MALVDAEYRFLFVEIGRNGRISDGGVFNRCDLRTIVEQAEKYLPPDTIIGNNKCLPYTIIGDDAFPLEKHILKPFPYNSSEKEKKIFNFRLSHARQTVEHAFGILANRFRVLQSKIHLRPQKVISVVQATCVLHNFLVKSSEAYSEPISRRVAAVPETCAVAGSARNASKTAVEVRNKFAAYFSEEGAISWQDGYIQ